MTRPRGGGAGGGGGWIDTSLVDVARLPTPLLQALVDHLARSGRLDAPTLATLSGAGLPRLHLAAPPPVSDGAVDGWAAGLSGLAGSLQALALPGAAVTNAAMPAVASLRGLLSLDLSRCTGLGDAGVVTLAGGLRRLQRLDLTACKRVGDVGVAALAALRSLCALTLDECAAVTGVGVAALAPLTGLEALSLRHCFRVDDAGVAPLLSSMPRLRVLGLSRTAATAEAVLPPLGGLSGLAVLALRGLALSDRDAYRFGGLSRLVSLDLRHCADVGDAVLEALAGLPHLAHLDISYTAVSDRGVAAAVSGGGLVALRALHADATAIGDAAVATFNALRRLATLSLDDTAVSSGGLAGLADLPCLRALSVAATGVGDAGLAALSGMTSLEVLDLDAPHVTDAGLVHLAGLPRLSRIDLWSAYVSDVGMGSLVALPRLTALTVCSGRLTDAAMVAVAVGLPGIVSLNVSQNRGLTDAGLLMLRSHAALAELTVCSTGAGDGLVAAVIGGGADGFPALTSLALGACSVSAALASRLKREVPSLHVVGLDGR